MNNLRNKQNCHEKFYPPQSLAGVINGVFDVSPHVLISFIFNVLLFSQINFLFT